MNILLVYDLSHVTLKIVLIYLYGVLVVCPNLHIFSLYFQNYPCLSFVSTWIHLHSLPLFKSFRQMLHWLLQYSPLHSFGSTFNFNRIFLYLLYNTKVTCQLSCYYLSLFSFLKTNNRCNFLLLHFLKCLTILYKRCHLGRKYRTLLYFFQFIESEIQNYQATFLNLYFWCKWYINIAKRILSIKEFFGWTQIRWKISSRIYISFQ